MHAKKREIIGLFLTAFVLLTAVGIVLHKLQEKKQTNETDLYSLMASSPHAVISIHHPARFTNELLSREATRKLFASFIPPVFLSVMPHIHAPLLLSFHQQGAVLYVQADAASAAALRDDMYTSIRASLLDRGAMALAGGTQTAQAMGLYYGVFRPEERRAAFDLLMQRIREAGGNFDCGFLGMHTLFHVLSEFGESETAYRMITQKEFPSYRELLDRGETAMVESFQPLGGRECGSHNHHFLGDVVRWFFHDLAGLEILDCRHVRVRPSFVRELDSARASYRLPDGVVSVAWQRENGRIALTVTHPAAVACDLRCNRAECDIREQIL